VIELLYRGAHIGGVAAMRAVDLDQRVRLFRPRRENAARPVILERAADEMDAVGQQGRGERVALQPLEALAVKGEIDLLGRYESSGARKTEFAAHLLVPP